MHTTLLYIMLCPTILCVSLAHSSVSQEPRPKAAAKRCAVTPIIDGELRPGEWTPAEVISGFRQIEPEYGQPSRYETTVFLMYDDEGLYVGAFCRDTDSSGFRIAEMHRDYTFVKNEGFGFTLDPLLNRRDAVGFFTTPVGAQLDVQSFDATIFDDDWNTIWWVATATTDSGWSCEFAIPWSSLRYTGGSKVVGINFLRLSRRANETSAWSLYPRLESVFRIDFAGDLVGVDVPASELNILLTPYSVVRRQSNALAGDDISWISGFDSKWTITPRATLELTYNTDFAQAEVDRQVVNLNRFDVQFPERRQFFLENSGLFRTTGENELLQPFFSRRIGLADDGSPEKIKMGGRLIRRGRLGNFGALALRTQPNDETESRDFLIGRYSMNYGRQNRIGALGTWRRSHSAVGVETNFTGGVDGFNRLNDKLFVSFSINGSTLRDDQDAVERTGVAGVITGRYLSDGVKLFFDQTIITRNFRAESGFVGWNDILVTGAGFDLFLRPKWRPKAVRDFEPAIYAKLYQRLSDRRFHGAELTVWPLYVQFESGGVVYAIWFPTWQRLDNTFSPTPGVEIAPREYTYHRFWVKAASDPSKNLAASITGVAGSFYNGSLQTLKSTLSLRPALQLAFNASADLNWFRSVGASSTTVTANVLALDIAITPTPRLNFSALYQRDDGADENGLHLRAVWEYRPLSSIYAVYNVGCAADSDAAHYENGVLKVVYVRQL